MSLVYDRTLQPLDIGLYEQDHEIAPFLAGLRARVGPWLQRHRVDLITVSLLTLLGALVHAAGMYASPARFDDEGTYTAYAWAVQYWHQLSHYTYWYAHPPLGWLQIAGWTSLTDGFDRAPYAIAAAREFMFVCKLVSIPVLYLLARRLGFGLTGRVLAVLIFSFSPLAVYFTRAALLDNVVTPWLLASFWFAASPRRSVRGAVFSAVAFSVATLTKETALLYLPAVLMLLWQFSDRRNRRFTVGLFGATFFLICLMYPMFALIKNELMIGPGHVSMEWAIRWQLFERTGSGDIFEPTSTAHAVIRSWVDLDPWLPRLSLLLVLPGLLLRRTRAIAFAFALQLVQLLRNGYLPYPYVIAMIPFAALSIAGVVDAAVGSGRRTELVEEEVDQLDELWRRSGPAPTLAERLLGGVQSFLGLDPAWQPAYGRGRALAGLRAGSRMIALVLSIWLISTVSTAWSFPLNDLRTHSRDAGKAAALAWVQHNVPRSAYLVVSDSLWVDLVRSGFPASHVIWFTKLDVDPDVRLPSRPQWAAIDYVVVDKQDDLSLHVQNDGKPSQDTLDLTPTLGRALAHSRLVQRFGQDPDSMTVRRVDPRMKLPRRRSGTSHGSSTGSSQGAGARSTVPTGRFGVTGSR
jgi:hypothetical protein